MKKLLLLLIIPFLSFGQQQTYVPDDNFEQKLIDNGLDNILDDYVLTENINSVEYVWGLSGAGIADLTGIEDFTALIELSVSDNNLTSLDVSNNINLLYLFCENNQLTTLNVSNNPLLNHLYCVGNLLTSLDVSNTPCVTWAEPWFSENATVDNPNLSCIQVDDVDCWNEMHSWSIDSDYQYYSTNCSETSIKELNTSNRLLQTIDVLGRETHNNKGFQLHIYDDGSVEKKYLIK